MTSLTSMQFYSSTLGQRMLSHEQAWLKSQLRTCVGTHALLLTNDPFVSCRDLFNDFYMLIDATEQSDDKAKLCCDFSALPISNRSVDVVVLQHCLSNANSPIDILREAERVLVPGGRLFILGENPYSLFAISLLLHKHEVSAKYEAKIHAAHAVKEWLAALDIHVQSKRSVFHEIPIHSGSLLRKSRRLTNWCSRNHLPFGGVYCLAAIKTARPVNTIRMKNLMWQPKLTTSQVAKNPVTKIQSRSKPNRN